VVSDKPLSVRQARAALEAADEDRRQAVVQELEALSSSEITDVLSWDEMGRVQVRASDQLSPRARRAIKKVKITPSEEGNTIEVEMHGEASWLA
jgi:DNA-binding protein H-NS